MKFNKYDIITFEDDSKVVILESLEYDGEVYLYVDKVNEDESDTLNKYHILKVYEDGSVQKETNQDILTKILPLFNRKLKIEE